MRSPLTECAYSAGYKRVNSWSRRCTSKANPWASASNRSVLANVVRNRLSELKSRVSRLRAWFSSICVSFCSWLAWLLIISRVRTAVSMFCTRLVGSMTVIAVAGWNPSKPRVNKTAIGVRRARGVMAVAPCVVGYGK
ncbi:hypothetical protein D3C85_1546310 [compost metagenome]